MQAAGLQNLIFATQISLGKFHTRSRRKMTSGKRSSKSNEAAAFLADEEANYLFVLA